MTKPITPAAGLPRVASIATKASRVETFLKVLPAIHAQVEHVFIYLDGYEAVPSELLRLDRISVRRAEEVGDLHCSSRFLCLRELARPSVVVIFDDDIAYPPDYVDYMAGVLELVGHRAIVGVHGRVFTPPHHSYIDDATVLHFGAALARPTHVHELGIGTSAFVSSQLDVDPRRWDRTDMDDIIVAAEAQRRGLPRIAVSRPAGWLRPYAEAQPDSLWIKAKTDDTEHSRRMRALLGLYA
jgi:hypothetical protein